MRKQKKGKYENVSTLKKVLVIVGLFSCLFGGMFMAIVAVDKFKNYLHPYTFAFLFGPIGFVIGFYVAKLLKPLVVLNRTMLLNYHQLSIGFSLGFFGGFMLLGHYVNSTISTKVKCDEFAVVDTEYIKRGYRRPESNILYVDIEGKTEKFLCRHRYWNQITVGKKVKVCIYNSPIGFDNLVLVDDQ